MDFKQDVTVNLSRLLRSDPGTEDEIEAEGLFMPIGIDLPEDYRLEDPLSYRLTIRAVGGNEYFLDGRVSGLATTACRRCLAPVKVDVTSRLMYAMEYEPGKGELTLRSDEDNEDILVFSRPEVDFAPLLAEIYAVDLPLTAACGPDVECHDLAAEFGQDEPIQSGEKDSPFASLKDFDPESMKE